jgi:hypothetical protein
MFAATLKRLLFAACLLATSQAIGAELALPDPKLRFADFPAEIYRGRTAELVVEGEYMEDYQDNYRAALNGKTIVAGHHALVLLPCGSTCVAPDLVNLKTGKSLKVPFNVSGWRKYNSGFKPVLARADSRLIVFQGGRNEKSPVGRHYYVVENGELKHLHTTDTDGDFRKQPKL